MEICRFKVYIQKDSLVTPLMDKMDEWLKRWTVNPLVSARVGSCPIFVVFLICSMVKLIAIWVWILQSKLKYRKKSGILKTSTNTSFEI